MRYCRWVAVCLLATTIPLSPGNARAEEVPDLKDLVDAFRPLVRAADWATKRFEIEPKHMKDAAEKAPRAKRKRYGKGFQEAQGLSFSLGGTEAYVEGVVARFDTARNAAAFVALEREIFAREKSTKKAKIKTPCFTKAAGPDETIPGFFIDRHLDFGGGLGLLIRAHYIHRGKLAAWLVLQDAPQVGIPAQHEIITYVDAHLRDPIAAQRLPKPDMEALAHRITLRILGPNGRPVQGVHVWVGPKMEEGKQQVSNKKGTVRLDGLDTAKESRLWIGPGVSKARVAWLVLPTWRPKSGDVRLKRGWTARGVVQDSTGSPVEARLKFEHVPAPASTDSEGRFEVRGLPRKGVKVVAVRATEPLSTPGMRAVYQWTEWAATKKPLVLRVTQVTFRPK